jgi:hypothetical protein
VVRQLLAQHPAQQACAVGSFIGAEFYQHGLVIVALKLWI